MQENHHYLDISFLNYISNQEVSYPLILIRGIIIINGIKDYSNLNIICKNISNTIEQSHLFFKCLYPLSIGCNSIQFSISLQYNNKLIRFDKTLQIFYKINNSSPYIVQFYYVTASNQSNRNYDGYNEEIQYKKQSNNSIYKNDCNKSSIELAKAKIGIAGLLIQCAFNELIQRYQLESIIGRNISSSITFQCKTESHYPLYGGAHVEHIILPKTQEYYENLNGNELWNEINAFMKKSNDENIIKVVIMGMTKWEEHSNNNLPKAHTALGGFPLALFGSGNIHTWPTCIEQIHSCFQDNRIIPKNLFDDSGHRKSFWANVSTGIGAIFHEIGHSFQLRHTNLLLTRKTSLQNPTMGRGFDHFNRIFTLSEYESINSSKKKILLHENEETNFHIHSIIRLLHNPFFSSSIKKINSFPAPLIERNAGLICIRSAIGIVEVSLYSIKSGDIVYTQPLGIFPPTFYTFSIISIKKLINHDNTFIGCTASDIYGQVSNELISLKVSSISTINLSHSQEILLRDEPIYRIANNTPQQSNKNIKIGSKIRLLHVLTNTYLQSHFFNYIHPNSSKMQLVSCGNEKEKENIQFEWLVIQVDINTDNSEYITTNKDKFGLLHIQTNKYLHSHYGHPSPLTNQQEVCCFSGKDENNCWICKPKDKSQLIWKDEDIIMLYHTNTKHYLHSHGGFTNEEYTLSQQEVTCYAHENDDNNLFIIELIE